MKEYVFHGIIEREGDVYCALCLELDIATESDTLEGAKKKGYSPCRNLHDPQGHP